jgi:N-acetylmuramoyl-L-alanine amidase
LSSTNHFLARTGKRLFALALLLAGLACGAAPARAQAAKSFWFVGTNLIFAKAQTHEGETAVAADDPGLGRFLAKLDASIAYDPGQRYVIVTSGDRRTIVFTIGDERYTVAGVTQSAPFAPYQAGGSVYLPLSALAKALYVLPVEQGATTILQPQIGALDVRTLNSVTTVTLRSALPVKFTRVSDASDEHVALSLGAVSTSLAAQRQVTGSAALHGLTFVSGGSARNPTTTVSFDVSPGTAHALAPSHSPNELAVAFSNRSGALAGPAIPAAGDYASGGTALATRSAAEGSPSAPTSEYAPLPSDVPAREAVPPPALQAAAHVTAVDAVPAGDEMNVRVTVGGPVNYEWHRLADNRWYVDLKDAVLDTPAREDQPQSDAVVSLRVKQISAEPDAVVRVALTLGSPRHIDVLPSAGGFTIAVGAADDPDAQRVGAGRISAGAVVANALPAAAAPNPAGGASSFWSKSASPAPVHLAAGTNPRLIVLDPGHGGSDFGAQHNGLTEKDLTLDISKRLKVLLIARGWQVKMTRETDVDVFAPNDSAHDELQARCDVANQAGARMFVSVHINSFTSSALNGTTTYYYKGQDLALGEAIHRHLAASLKTADRGVKKENFYVIHHTDMPAVLIETAFLSNPGDAEYLRSPAFLQQVALAIADGIGDYASNAPQVNVSPTSDGQ